MLEYIISKVTYWFQGFWIVWTLFFLKINLKIILSQTITIKLITFFLEKLSVLLYQIWRSCLWDKLPKFRATYLLLCPNKITKNKNFPCLYLYIWLFLEDFLYITFSIIFEIVLYSLTWYWNSFKYLTWGTVV